MKYKNYVLEDFLADKNFVQWVINSGAESDKYWHEFLHNYPEKRELIEEAITLLKRIQFRKLCISVEEKDRILRNTIALKYTDRAKDIESSPKKMGSIKFTQITAIIFIFISAVTFLTFQFSTWTGISRSTSPEVEEMMTKENPAGRKSRFYLPDGSYVTLNADSKIDYYSNFEEKREVWLSGEASFEVKEHLGNNFLVHTENLNMIVKGTTFNVSAFPNELHESISLLTGKVNVSCRKDRVNQAYKLIPG